MVKRTRVQFEFCFQTQFAIMLSSDTDCGLMYTHPGIVLLSDTHFAMMLLSDTDFGLMCTRSARHLRSDTHVAILFRSDTGFNVHTFC